MSFVFRFADVVVVVVTGHSVVVVAVGTFGAAERVFTVSMVTPGVVVTVGGTLLRREVVGVSGVDDPSEVVVGDVDGYVKAVHDSTIATSYVQLGEKKRTETVITVIRPNMFIVSSSTSEVTLSYVLSKKYITSIQYVF